MDKKKLTSWGVSFSSLALIAGMVGYLGITNKNTSGNTSVATAQTQVVQQNTTQTSQSSNNLTLSKTTTPSNRSSSGNNSIAAQHDNFDTTTRGS